VKNKNPKQSGKSQGKIILKNFPYMSKVKTGKKTCSPLLRARA
jgi:hypothetical protein